MPNLQRHLRGSQMSHSMWALRMSAGMSSMRFASLVLFPNLTKTPPGDRCWTQCLHAGHQRCPKCRCEIQVESIQWNEAMQTLLGSMRVKCEEATCHWTGTLQAYEHHRSNCPARMLQNLQREHQVAQADAVAEKTLAEETRECLIQTLQEKDEEISSLSTSFENLTQIFHAAMRELRTKQEIIEREKTRLVTQNNRIQSLSRQLESSTYQVQSRDTVLAAMDALILEKNAKIARMQTESAKAIEPQQKKPRKAPTDAIAKKRKR